MTEEFLQYIWKHGLTGKTGLQTSEGKSLEIIKLGIHNRDAGPDFFNARLIIDGIHWAGNVEVHIKSSAWGQHKHQFDEAYRNVILHVVWEDDEPVFRSDKSPIPALELKSIIPQSLLDRYTSLRYSSKEIPCGAEIKNIDSILLHSWMERLVAERLERKGDAIALKLNNTINDWEEVFYHTLLTSLGNPVNSMPFELLATFAPVKLILKHGRNLMETEALLFGQAGMLNGNFTEDYPRKLQKEYLYQKHKLNLTPMEGAEWKFARIRPFNFPSLRIAQAAAIIQGNAPLFRKVIEARGINDIIKLFSATPSEYWHTHYRFVTPGKTKATGQQPKKPEKPGETGNGVMGISTLNMLIINAVVPILFMYGKSTFNDDLCRKALNLLHGLKPEKNSLTDDWEHLGIKAADAYDSQALIELRKSFCNEKRCVHCAVGHQVMKKR